MKRVVVTGACGEIGRWVTSRFVREHWHVIGIDISTPRTGVGASQEDLEFRAADLTNPGTTRELIAEIDPDAVVHLAAIPRNGIRSDTETFRINVTTTHNVLEAAGRLGTRVVWTSSDSIYGAVQAPVPPMPAYLPVDEAYPKAPADPYGTSKLVGEEIAKAVARRYGTPVVSIRPVKVVLPGRYGWIEAFQEQFDPVTAERNGGYWSYVDARDVATAVETAARADISGHEPILLAADENYLDRPTADAIERVFGDLPSECAVSGEESAYSTRKARDLLDWEPRHSWRTARNKDVPSPAFSVDG
jgi:nucleoside-diphosphate-sugar epimerase